MARGRPRAGPAPDFRRTTTSGSSGSATASATPRDERDRRQLAQAAQRLAAREREERRRGGELARSPAGPATRLRLSWCAAPISANAAKPPKKATSAGEAVRQQVREREHDERHHQRVAGDPVDTARCRARVGRHAGGARVHEARDQEHERDRHRDVERPGEQRPARQQPERGALVLVREVEPDERHEDRERDDRVEPEEGELAERADQPRAHAQARQADVAGGERGPEQRDLERDVHAGSSRRDLTQGERGSRRAGRRRSASARRPAARARARRCPSPSRRAAPTPTARRFAQRSRKPAIARGRVDSISWIARARLEIGRAALREPCTPEKPCTSESSGIQPSPRSASSRRRHSSRESCGRPRARSSSPSAMPSFRKNGWCAPTRVLEQRVHVLVHDQRVQLVARPPRRHHVDRAVVEADGREAEAVLVRLEVVRLGVEAHFERLAHRSRP